MASASMTPVPDDDSTVAPRASGRRRTAHLKLVPESREARDRLRAVCADVVSRLDKSCAMTKDEMEQVARRILHESGISEGYVGWTMVVLATEFWREQVAAVPPARRLFLLPHCLKHAAGCPAEYDDVGLACKECGACSIADFRSMAEEMGYKVLVAEGSPIVLKIIVGGYVDAIVGVACLNVLEKAIDKILLAGIPCMAVPLLSSDCRNTSVDEDWVEEMIRESEGTVRDARTAVTTRSYLHLLRAAARLFDSERLDRITPRLRGGPRLSDMNGQGVAGLDPIAATEAIAYDFLAKGGKYSRPFITLAAYDALSGDRCTGAAGARAVESIPESVCRTAMSIETFHKASLVHDDIEDHDAFRYGEATLHARYGVPTAINVGDYLIGMGYRLVSREAAQLGSDVVSDILDALAEAHMRLSEGQGAELLWRDARDKRLQPIDALKIYALKTSPAFEAALYCGVRLATDAALYAPAIRRFSRNLGVAFQILNDLIDWQGDSHNKLSAGGDVLGGRPTVLWALALEGLDASRRDELLRAVAEDGDAPTVRVARVRALYEEAGAFDNARRLVEKHRQRAESIADAIEPEPLRRLLRYLVDSVIRTDESSGTPPAQVVPTIGLAGA